MAPFQCHSVIGTGCDRLKLRRQSQLIACSIILGHIKGLLHTQIMAFGVQHPLRIGRGGGGQGFTGIVHTGIACDPIAYKGGNAGGIALTKLAHIVVTPGPDSTITIQKHTKAVASHHIGNNGISGQLELHLDRTGIQSGNQNIGPLVGVGVHYTIITGNRTKLSVPTIGYAIIVVVLSLDRNGSPAQLHVSVNYLDIIAVSGCQSDFSDFFIIGELGPDFLRGGQYHIHRIEGSTITVMQVRVLPVYHQGFIRTQNDRGIHHIVSLQRCTQNSGRIIGLAVSYLHVGFIGGIHDLCVIQHQRQAFGMTALDRLIDLVVCQSTQLAQSSSVRVRYSGGVDAPSPHITKSTIFVVPLAGDTAGFIVVV